jgi:hypothetical protein
MFAEDVRRLLPYDRGVRDGFTARIEPEDPVVQKAVRLSLPTQYYPAHTLNDGLRSATESIGYGLVTGPVHIEIAAPQDDDEGASFLLHVVPPGTVGKTKAGPVQYVPQSYSPHVHRGVHFIALNAATLVTVDLPPSDRRMLRAALQALQAIDLQQGVPVEMITRAGGAPGFSVEEHRRLVSAYARAETRSTGWDGRSLFTESMLEPYLVWRRLQFARFQIVVRNAALDGLQRAVDLAGSILGFVATITVSDVLTPDAIELAERELQSGSRPLIELSRLAHGLAVD